MCENRIKIYDDPINKISIFYDKSLVDNTYYTFIVVDPKNHEYTVICGSDFYDICCIGKCECKEDIYPGRSYFCIHRNIIKKYIEHNIKNSRFKL